MSTSNRQQQEQRWNEIMRKYGSRQYGKTWKPSTPLAIKIEAESLMKELSHNQHAKKTFAVK